MLKKLSLKEIKNIEKSNRQAIRMALGIVITPEAIGRSFFIGCFLSLSISIMSLNI